MRHTGRATPTTPDCFVVPSSLLAKTGGAPSVATHNDSAAGGGFFVVPAYRRHRMTKGARLRAGRAHHERNGVSSAGRTAEVGRGAARSELVELCAGGDRHTGRATPPPQIASSFLRLSSQRRGVLLASLLTTTVRRGVDSLLCLPAVGRHRMTKGARQGGSAGSP